LSNPRRFATGPDSRLDFDIPSFADECAGRLAGARRYSPLRARE
jgi:hypothetical protein